MLKEGLVLSTYLDIVGVPTVCYGETGPHVRLGQRYTAEACRRMLDERLVRFAVELDRCIERPLADHEAAAVLSWAYNVGVGAACSSTLVKMINAGSPAQEWCQQLDRWVYARGFRVNGLVVRRQKEKALCLGAK
jgi:lysozyme